MSWNTPYSKPLNLSRATVLITGGGTGIGLGLVAEFLAAGSSVIISGRRADKLAEAKHKYPTIHTVQSDVSKEADRRALATHLTSTFPALNVVVHNAGVLHFSSLTQLTMGAVPESDGWSTRVQEIDTNVTAPVHLTSLLLPHLLQQPEAALVFVSSLFAFAPAVISPAYSATKAFIHNFAVGSRQCLQETRVQVYEVAPPLVKTDMSGHNGVECDEYCKDVMDKLKKGHKEMGYQSSEQSRLADRDEQDRLTEANTKQAAAMGLFRPYQSA